MSSVKSKTDCPIIAVDLGGTNLRIVRLVNTTWEASTQLEVPQSDDKQVLLDLLMDSIKEFYDKDIAGIGIGVPGLVDRKEGIVYDMVNIPAWKEVALAEQLNSVFSTVVKIDNDANCFALGERYYGIGQKYSDFVGLTMGTGLGAGIIKEGGLIADKFASAGEFGMIPYKNDILEMYCSGQFFKEESGKSLAEKAKKGNPYALQQFKEFGFHLAEAIKIILYTVSPEAILLGGSVSKSFDYFKESMYSGLKDFAYKKVLNQLKIERSTLDNAAIYGAASLIKHYLRN